ncbi:MAG TPA: aminopeptidase [Spirochaetia bacterium]|nr:aminopeptidase [Spirochaetia bacterium]
MKAAALALAVLISALSGCQTDLGYLVKQGGWLYHYSRGTRNIDSLLESPSTPEDTRGFLLTVKDIRRFAVEKVGLRDNGNYTRYRSIDRDHLVDVVQACDAVSFAPYQWSYPLLGRLPYKGFYERADAEAEASRLKKAGYDVIVRGVDAFSTLGFFHDPLYSFMKKYPPFELASTIIHEQTHATLFVRGQPEFNEELATFVGDTGAFQWLEERYGTGSEEYRDALDQRADFDLFVAELKGLSAELKKVYDQALPREETLAEKARIIAAFKGTFRRDAGRFRTPEYRAARDLPLNNAYLSLYDLYTEDIPLLRSYEEKRCGGDLRSFMLAAERLSKKGDIKEQMRAELAAGDSH